ncbi:oxidoreductase [Amorphoplanes auranticolor]|uniref:Oxidoreductase n=2 Tax=Actinoplanes auranticolor TaxID=47988 RepID=A0A919SX19_9ACTN|nr:oxidoreductase [Actinoplanes auranticolor]
MGMLLSRRTLLRAAVVAVPATGFRSGPIPAVSGPTAGDWKALAAGLEGSVELPGGAAFARAHRLVDPRFDAVRPPAVARCAGPADVTDVIRFARRFGVPVVPRGGGHSYVGASTSRTGVVLDLRGLRAIAYDAGSRTATIGGGARLIDVYDRLDAHGVSIPSGSCGSVGIGGITLGGGIGMAASAYGMTCDAVVAAELVTADGRHRTVHAGREPDLFWALRGGGGAQLGVVTSWRMRTYPAAPAGTFVLTYPWNAAARAAAGWQARLARSPDETWSSCQFAAGARGARSVRIAGVVLGGAADAEVAAIVRAIGREPATVRIERLPHRTLVHNRGGCDDAGDCGPRATELVGSDVFPRILPPEAVAALLAAVERRARARRPGIAKLKRMTGVQSRVAPGTTAFPWRGAHTMLQWLVQPPAGDAATVRDAYAWIEGGHRAVARWSAGRYVNYLEPDPAQVPRYYGPNLARLRRVRAAADPDRLFRSPYAV